MKTSFIIPFKNEKEYAPLTLEKVYSFFTEKGLDFEIVAVDDSDDGTWEILQHFAADHSGVTVAKGGEPPGYGKALKKGFSVARGEIIIPFNGDLCDSLDDALAYVRECENGYDMVFGSRYMAGGKILDYPSVKVLISRAGNLFLQLIFGARCSDVTNTFKAFRRHVIEAVDPKSDGYDLGLEIALKAILRGYTYKTIPVTWTGREYGSSKMVIAVSFYRHLYRALSIRAEHLFRPSDRRSGVVDSEDADGG